MRVNKSKKKGGERETRLQKELLYMRVREAQEASNEGNRRGRLTANSRCLPCPSLFFPLERRLGQKQRIANPVQKTIGNLFSEHTHPVGRGRRG